jgi:hypothetical protein
MGCKIIAQNPLFLQNNFTKEQAFSRGNFCPGASENVGLFSSKALR